MTGERVLTPLRWPFCCGRGVESQGVGEWWVQVERGVWLVGGPWAGKGPLGGFWVTSERRDFRRRRR